MNNENKYLNLLLFIEGKIYLASSLIESKPLELGFNNTVFNSDKWERFYSIDGKILGSKSIDLTRSGGYFVIDQPDADGYILFDSPSTEAAKKCMLKLLKYYEKDVA